MGDLRKFINIVEGAVVSIDSNKKVTVVDG